ncbi:MAG: hypothetical protein FWG14_05610 [Peptococcaceae bacterium]|nr:hypothetical protein [Peptococcaceae bacterium]
MVKEEALKLISNMADNVSLDEIMYQLFILDKHNKATEDITKGRLHTSEDIRKSLEQQ